MGLIWCYCEKCGKFIYIVDEDLDDIKNETCSGCDNIGFIKTIPNEYLNEYGSYIADNRRQDFIEKVIKVSPNFDQSCWDRREEIQEVNERQWEIIRAHMKEQSNIPRCPTCSSTDLTKISTTSKVINTVLWGGWGVKRYKTFHCNHCGYEW